MHSAALFVRLINTFYALKNFHFRAECYAALPFVHLLLDSTFLTISRLATLFMHDLNTVFIFEALVTLCYFVLSLYRFECTTTFDRPLFWEVCPMHSVSVIMHVFSWNLAFFYTVTAVLLIVFCHLYFSISFVATSGLLGYIYLELPLPSAK